MIGPPPGSLLRIGESIVNCHKPLDTLQLVPINSILWVPLGQVLGKMVFVEKCSKPMGELQQNHGFLQLKICNFGGLPPYFWTSQHHGKLMAHGTWHISTAKSPPTSAKLARWPWNLQRRSQSSPTRPVSGWNRHAAATATGSSRAAENGYGIHSMAMKNRSSGWSNWEVCSCKTLQKTKSWQRTKFIWIYMGLCSLTISSMAKLAISQNNIAMDSDRISVWPSFSTPTAAAFEAPRFSWASLHRRETSTASLKSLAACAKSISANCTLYKVVTVTCSHHEVVTTSHLERGSSS